MRIAAATALALAIVSVLLAGPHLYRRLPEWGRSTPRWLRRAVLGSVVLLIGLAVLSIPYVRLTGYGAYVAASTLSFVALLALGLRFHGATDRLYRIATGWNPYVLAGVVALAAVAVCHLIFENIPHVSDEVAYQFQARTLAQGGLVMPAPPHPEFFTFIHTMVQDGRWYGIMNPGWPALLALGTSLDVAWIVNPILMALSVVLFHRFYRDAGYTRTQIRVATLLLALAPLTLFMSGTYMAHPANLFLFGLFCVAWIRMIDSGRHIFAIGAGLALGANLLVRPLDAAFVAIPFFIDLLIRAWNDRRWLSHLVLAGSVASTGIVLTLLYNEALTGSFLEMPMTRYFLDRDPGQKFGVGFGPEMGTTLHGPEWPGYYPSDALRVTSYRLLQFGLDLNGLPLLLFAAVLLPMLRSEYRSGRWHRVLLGSGLSLLAIYALHFYHGIAYGSRHYFLAVPALGAMIAVPLGRWIDSDRPVGRRLARAGLVALVLHTLIFAYPPLIREYGDRYRRASGALREAVTERGIQHALVFVSEDNWGWKSAFPLNEYPLESSPVIFAKDLGEENRRLRTLFPDRPVYRARIRRDDSVALEALESGTHGGS